MVRRLALVEDDEVLRRNYADLLGQAGFSVDTYADRDSALRAFSEQLPDIALLDISLGSERDAGFELCSELRRRSPRLPIIFLTSHDGDVDRISGLRIGADDYLTKDVSIDYLIARIETLMRRLAAVAAYGTSSDASTRRVGPESILLDEATSRAFWKGRDLQLPLTQYWMLRELVRLSGQVVGHDELMRAARIVVAPNTVTAHVKAIRDSFRRTDPAFNGIRTERGRGYRWAASANDPAVNVAEAAASL